MSRVQDMQAVLWACNRRLDDATRALTTDQVTGPSYCKDWSIAQVLSHLGSGAEIFGLRLESVLSGTEQPGQAESEKVWERWNAVTPEEQVHTSITADAELMQRIDTVPTHELDAISTTLFGMHVDGEGLLATRLAEHGVHTWDVAVMSEPDAALTAAAAGLMIDHLDLVVRYTGKTDGGPLETEITSMAGSIPITHRPPSQPMASI